MDDFLRASAAILGTVNGLCIIALAILGIGTLRKVRRLEERLQTAERQLIFEAFQSARTGAPNARDENKIA